MSGSPVWDVERMRPVVLEWDAALRAEVPAYARLVPESEKRGSVLHPPATGEAVAAAELRLGVRLPPSYQSFLLVADGAEAGGFSANRVERLSPSHRQELLSVQDIVAFADEERLVWLVEMWRDTMQEFADRQASPSADAPVEVFDFQPGARALLVTRPVQDGIIGLVPFPGEWQVWEFFHSEVMAHQSFASYLCHHARHARQRVADRADRVRAAVADGSSVAEVWDLADHGDLRAVEAACRALLDAQHSHDGKLRVALTLMYLGDPKAIPVIRAALRGITDPNSSSVPDGLSPEGVEQSRAHLEHSLLKALDSCGDSEIVGELERRAATSPATDSFAAQYLATRDQLPRW